MFNEVGVDQIKQTPNEEQNNYKHCLASPGKRLHSINVLFSLRLRHPLPLLMYSESINVYQAFPISPHN